MRACVAPESGRLSPRQRLWCWLLFALVLYTPLTSTYVGRGNVASDLAAIESLAGRATFFIDDSPFVHTIDKFRRPDGRFFSQKSPVFHVVAAAPAWLLDRAGYPLAGHAELHLRALTLLMVILPMGWLLWLVETHPWVARHSTRWRIGFTLLLAAGSLLTPFAVTLNHYALAAAGLLAAVNTLMTPPGEGHRARLAWGARVGVAASISLAADVPPAFLFGGAVGLGLSVRALRGDHAPLAGLVLGAAPLTICYAALNWAIIGSPLPANLHEQSMLYFPGSYWSEIRAAAEAGNPGYYQAGYVRRLWHATLGHKGIYWMMPALAVATAGAVWLAGSRRPGWPWALAWAAFPLLAVAVTMRWAFDLSGGAYAIRHVLATLPPLYCVLAHPALRLPRRGRARWIWRIGLGAPAAWSVLIAAIGVWQPWSHNTLSAYPPLENVARWCLASPERRPVRWIGGLIEATSVKPANGWLDLGLAHQHGLSLDEAERALRRAAHDPGQAPLAMYHLGIVQDRRGRPLDALATYDRLLALQPRNVGAWNNAGLFALKAGRPAQAQARYRRALELAPHHPSSMWGLLLIEELAGRARADHPMLREALERHPDDARIRELARRWGAGLPSAGRGAR